jgi:hypothetical protein
VRKRAPRDTLDDSHKCLTLLEFIARRLLCTGQRASWDRRLLSIWITCSHLPHACILDRERNSGKRHFVQGKRLRSVPWRWRAEIRLASGNDDSGNGTAKNGAGAEQTIARLLAHIAALEQELANYGSKYGFTDRARELLSGPARA